LKTIRDARCPTLLPSTHERSKQEWKKGTEMIRLGKSIRLTRREVERFTKITGFEPVNVRTLDDLDRYIRKCKAHFWGESEDTRFLHFLLDEERLRCLA
jgi:hypothetical protein